MTELPELSGVQKRVRPLPAGGVDAAVRAGRRRRNRVIGVGTGGVTAIALVAAFLLAAPGSHQETLQPAEQPPVSKDGVTAPPAPAVVPAAAAAEARRLAAQQAAGQARAAAAPPAAHRPTAAAAPPSSERDDYTESPRDQAAPQTCRQGPQGQTGPIVYGGATACGTSSTGPASVKRGGRAYGSTDLCVPYDAKATVLGYSGGQEHEVKVTNSEGELVYRFSDTVRFVQGPHRRTIGAGRCLVWTGEWDTTYTNGKLVPAGRYEVTLALRPSTIGGRKPEPGEGVLSFSVDVK